MLELQVVKRARKKVHRCPAILDAAVKEYDEAVTLLIKRTTTENISRLVQLDYYHQILTKHIDLVELRLIKGGKDPSLGPGLQPPVCTEPLCLHCLLRRDFLKKP